MQAPPSISAEVRKLRTVSATTGDELPAEISSACSAIAARPAIAAAARIAVRARVKIRPIVAQ